jgi:O-antigen/teichoic acid export membrane protein
MAARARGTAWVIRGAAVAAIGAYGFQALAAHALGEHDYAPIGVLWTVQYLVLSTGLYSVENYVVRTVTMDGAVCRRHRRTIVMYAGALSLGVLAVGMVAARQLFASHDSLALIAAILVVGYAGFVVARGLLAGAESYRAYGVVTATESVARLGVLVAVVMVADGTNAVAWSMPTGAVAAVVVAAICLRLRARRLRAAPVHVTRADDDLLRAKATTDDRPARFLAHTVVPNAAAQTLLAAGPLAVLALGGTEAAVSTFVVTFALARAPLVVVQGGVLSRILPALSRQAANGDTDALRRAARILRVATLASCTVVALGAAAVGGPVVGALFGSEFRPAWWLAASAAVTALLTAGVLVLGQLLVAAGRESRLVAPWLCAIAVSAGVIAVAPVDPSARVALGFVAGACTAFALVHRAVGVVTAHRPGVPALLRLAPAARRV